MLTVEIIAVLSVALGLLVCAMVWTHAHTGRLGVLLGRGHAAKA